MASVLVRSLVALVATAGPAWAAPNLVTIPAPPSGLAGQDLSNSTIFLNRCTGSCLIHPGMRDDSSTDTSAIVHQDSNLPEYAGFAAGEWDAIVACVKEVYSPYGVNIVDARPASGDYGMIYVGGKGADVGETMAGVGGVALLTADCSPSSLHGVAYAFTDQIDVFAREDGSNRVNGMCWIIAQETAHIYGLDHEYAFEDGMSACNDPMTYRDDCGGRKYFRNHEAKCGEFNAPRPKCGPTNMCDATQSSHGKLTALFGSRAPTFAPPTATMTLPIAMSQVTAGTMVVVTASAPRGVARLELWINGFHWGATVKGAPFASTGQPESIYQLVIPADLPDSILDLTVKAFDDLGGEGDTQTITVSKGPATGCADASTCAKGQQCANGRCFWDPPTGEVGDDCSFDQACKSLLCTGTETHTICTHGCTLDATAQCEDGLTCIATSDTKGVCFPPDNGGCCSVGRTSVAGTALRMLLALGALGIVLRRRR